MSVIKQAIYEVAYEKEQETFNKYLVSKAKLLKGLRDKDLFLLPEAEAMQLQKQINDVDELVKVLHGFNVFTEDMKQCYEESIDKLYEAYPTFYCDMMEQIAMLKQQLKEKDIQLKTEQQLHLNCMDTVNVFVDLAIQQTQKIIELQKQIK